MVLFLAIPQIAVLLDTLLLRQNISYLQEIDLMFTLNFQMAHTLR